MEITCHILGKDISCVIHSLNKDNLDKSIFNKLSHKMVMNNNVLGLLACGNILSKENCASIVNAHNDRQLDWNTNRK